MNSASVKRAFVAMALVAMCLTATQAFAATMAIDDPVRLSDIIENNGTLVAGDKEFSNFEYIAISDDDSEMPADTAVFVTPIVDDEGNYGIRIDGNFGDSEDTPSGSNATLIFNVTVLDPLSRVVGASLFGDVFAGGPQGSVGVIETLRSFDLVNNYRMSIQDRPGNPNSTDEDSVTFTETDPVQKFQVIKDIFARAPAGSLDARVTTIEQIYRQVRVPEPSAYLLMGMMGAAIAAYRYRLG